MLRFLFATLFGLHGLIHLMGFAKAFNLAEMSRLTLPISKLNGLIWLLAAGLFAVTIPPFIMKKEWWWTIALAAAVISQIEIVLFWQDAKFGTLANLIVILAIIWNFARVQKPGVETEMLRDRAIESRIADLRDAT